MRYHAINPRSVTVDCDTQADLREAILELDLFQFPRALACRSQAAQWDAALTLELRILTAR